MPETTWVFIKSEPKLWTVGFFRPNGEWEIDDDYSSRDEAAQRVRWLNGGKIAELTDTHINLILKSLATLLRRSHRVQDQVRIASDKSDPFVDPLAVQIETIIRSRRARRGE